MERAHYRNLLEELWVVLILFTLYVNGNHKGNKSPSIPLDQVSTAIIQCIFIQQNPGGINFLSVS